MSILAEVREGLVGNKVVYMTEAEVDLFSKYVSMDGDYFEIGTFNGGSAIITALLKKRGGFTGQVYTLDAMIDLHTSKLKEPSDDMKKRLTDLPKNFKKFGVADRITFIHKDSQIMFLDSYNPRTSFIDGDHSFFGCLNDWMKLEKITQQYIMIHDYNPNYNPLSDKKKPWYFPGVVHCVDTVVRVNKDWEEKAHVDSLIIFERKSYGK